MTYDQLLELIQLPPSAQNLYLLFCIFDCFSWGWKEKGGSFSAQRKIDWKCHPG